MKAFLNLIALTMVLAGCGGTNNAPVQNAPQDPGHNHADGHNHLYSHEGEDIGLGSAKSGEHTFTVTQKGKPKRDGLTVMEVQVEGPEFSMQDLQGEVFDSAGKEVVPIGGFHAMAEKGRFGAHIGLPKDAPTGLKLRLRLRGTDSAKSAEFSIKE